MSANCCSANKRSINEIPPKCRFMNRLIKVYWYNHPGGNFGDEISPYLVRKISGKEPICCSPSFWGALHDLYHAIFTRKSFKEAVLRLLFLFMQDDIIIGVGSILEFSNIRTIIWGTGFGHNNSIIKRGRFLAVRGQESARKLLELNLKVPSVLGDPALLLPLYYKPIVEKKFQVGIIPHISDFDFFYNNWSDKYKIINLNTRDVESVVNQINECEYILSTSLHGIIVSHAYNVPCLWIEKIVLERDGFKFKDYFTSVGIEPYCGFRNVEELLSSEERIISLFVENINKSHINVSLSGLQTELLGVCPFKNNRF